MLPSALRPRLRPRGLLPEPSPTAKPLPGTGPVLADPPRRYAAQVPEEAKGLVRALKTVLR